MGKKPGGRKQGFLGPLIGFGLIVGICALFFLDPGSEKKPKEPEASSSLNEEEKDAKAAERDLTEFAEALEAQRSNPGRRALQAAKYAAEARDFLNNGSVLDGLDQRPRWVTAFAPSAEPRTNEVQRLTSRNFFQEVASTKRVLTMWFSPTCIHCKNVEPHFRAAASEVSKSVSFAMLDSTKMRNVSLLYNVTRLPTLLFFVNGYPHEARLPNATKSDIVNWVNFRSEDPMTTMTEEDYETLLTLPDLATSNLAVFRGSDEDFEYLGDVAEGFRKTTIFLRVVSSEPPKSSTLSRLRGSEVVSTYSGPWEFDDVREWLLSPEGGAPQAAAPSHNTAEL
jgi:thiol-disulfide isomerase/thioredoxin